MFNTNPLLDTDSYKLSHSAQYPAGAEGMFSYIESRGGQYPATIFFGLQYFIKEYLSKPFTANDIEEAVDFAKRHGEPFDEEAAKYVLEEHGGFAPVEIRAVPEGCLVPTSNALVTVESTDPKVFHWVSPLETSLLRAVWYPTTVATQSYYIKQTIKAYLEKTSDDPAGQLPFKLHDFGARGVSSKESAAVGGAAHLVNFMGSDTISGVLLANKYYSSKMAGFSIPAAEHSTITSWGRDGEVEAYRNMLRQFAREGSMVAIVSDSYDLYNAVSNMWGGELRNEVIKSGATVIIRPDSGTPWEVVPHCLALLAEKFGYTLNNKGFKVLNNVRVIQGDGINGDSIRKILDAMVLLRFSADNVAFGMGGALLQIVNRDTQKFAMKCSAINIGGTWRNVFKDPATDHGKRSKAGRLRLLRNRATGEYSTTSLEVIDSAYEDALVPVYRNGEVLKTYPLDEVRANTNR